MTKEEFAARITGREYREEMTPEEEKLAKKHGLVVVFGASDDIAEFRGVINGEAGCYEGREIFLSQKVFDTGHDCNCEYCAGRQSELKKGCAVIEALWCKEEGYSFTYKTSIPHATFEVIEGDGKYCRGIVFNFSDLPTA